MQPSLAVGLLVLLFIAQRMLGEHAGRTEYRAMGAIVVGVIGIALCAPPRTHTHTSEELTITLVLLGLGLASLIPYVLRRSGISPRRTDDVSAPGSPSAGAESRPSSPRMTSTTATSSRRPRGRCRRLRPRAWAC